MTRLISTATLLQSSVNFKELTLNQYRQLLKCFIGDDISPAFIFSNTNSIIKELTDLTQYQIDNLSFLDYCILLFYIRLVSIGDTVFLTVETPENKQLKIDLRTSKVIEQITKSKVIDLLQPEINDHCEIEFRLPSIKEILFLEQEEDLYNIYTFFLKTLKISNTIINLEDFSYKDREEIIQKIPIRVMTSLTKRTHSLIETCNEINLLDFLKSKTFDKKLILTLNSQLISFVIKLIYNTSLESVYDFMFALSKFANLSCSFLDECSPGEFFLFSKKLEEVSFKQTQPETARSSSNNELPPIVSEFGLE